MVFKKSYFVLFSSFLIVSCGQDNTPTPQASTEENIVSRQVDPRAFSQGKKLYQKNCAECHGKNAEGAQNWQKPDAEDKYPAPPLNGTAHSWHHSEKSLTNTIKNGTAKLGGNMPAWKGKLSDGEISLILTWIKAQWPDELYSAWYNRFHQTK